MNAVLVRASARFMLDHPLQLFLSMLGIALGVAVVVSISIANQSAKRSFQISTDAVAGRSTHQITGGPLGLSEDLYRVLRVERGIRDAAPIVEGYVSLPSDGDADRAGHLRLLGVDPFAEAPFRPYLSGGSNADLNALVTRSGSVLISTDMGNRMRLTPGDAFQILISGFRHEVTVVGLIEPADDVGRQAFEDLIVADIATAQELTGMIGRLSRIDLVLPEGQAGVAALDTIMQALPPDAEVSRTAARSESVETLTRAFELNLTALSLLALLVGTFLIYNAVSFSVVRRRGLIGVLRAIGVTRGQVFGLIVGEALVVGAASAVIGVALGVLLGRGLVDVVSRTINDLFFSVSVRELSVSPSVIAMGFVLGIGATLLASLLPALEAANVPVRVAMTRSSVESRLRSAMPWAALGGVLLVLTGAAVLMVSSRSLVASFGGLFAVVVGFALITPLAMALIARGSAPVVSKLFGLPGAMAVRGVSSSLSRTAVAVAALTIAVSITVGIGTMVQSFRGTVERWLDTSLSGDIYVSPPSRLSSRSEIGISPEIIDGITALPEVAAIDAFRGVEVSSSKGDVQLLAIGTSYDSFAIPGRYKAGDPSQIWEDFQRGDVVLVSEPFAYHNDVDVRDTLGIVTAGGMRDFPIAAVYFDYSSSQGVVMMSQTGYLRFWEDDAVSSVRVTLNDGVNVEAAVAAIRGLAEGEQELSVRSNRDLREASLRVFDRSFTITSVMRLLAMLVAFVGVLSALTALQLERGREYGTLRALGFTPGQIWGLVTAQTGIMGLIAGLLSLPIGAALAAALIFVVNRRSFGWSMDMQIIPSVMIEAMLLAVGAALIAGVYPSIRMSRSSPAEALREE